MAEPTKPKTWLDLILLILRMPEDRRFQSSLDRLIDQNKTMNRITTNGFLYQGQPYTRSDNSDHPKTFQSVHADLYGEVEFFLGDKVRVTNELKVIAQAMKPLIDPCTDLQEIRDALPEPLIAAIQAATTEDPFKGLERTREPAWNLDPLSRSGRQFKAILPKLEEYTAARFLY